MNALLQEVILKHKKFLALNNKLSKDLEKNLYDWFKIALTYSSNAIEGNTLSHAETAEVVEKNITIAGKSLVEHLEAVNHAEAIDFAKNLSTLKNRKSINLDDILLIHKLILQKINDNYAGKLRDIPVRIMGSNIPVPNYLKINHLMNLFVSWLHNSSDDIIKITADAHLKLVYIHPFIDGNGRTARLLMNLLLLQENYPLVYIKVEDRIKYIKAIQKALEYINSNFSAEDFVLSSSSLDIKEFHDYYEIIFKSIESSLDQYIEAIESV